MSKKDEIITLQNEIMQNLIRQNMRGVGADLWGRKTEIKQEACAEEQGKVPAPEEARVRCPFYRRRKNGLHSENKQTHGRSWTARPP